jgi:hypothetical protein
VPKRIFIYAREGAQDLARVHENSGYWECIEVTEMGMVLCNEYL